MKRSPEAKATQLFADIPVRLHFRSDLHLLRKAFHMIMGLVIVYFYMADMSRAKAVLILAPLLGLDLLLEASRLRKSSLNQRVLKYWGPFMRAHESQRFSTVPHFLTSAIIAILVFPKPVAVLGLLYLACGDPAASLAGILYGHKSVRFSNGKTLIGTLMGVTVCALVTGCYLKSQRIAPDNTLVVLSILGGLAGGLSELLPFEMDDNFTIPIVSGFAVWLAFLLFGI
jgi:dolichol kinase